MATKKPERPATPVDADPLVHQLNDIFMELELDAFATAVSVKGNLQRFTLQLGPKTFKKIDTNAEYIAATMKAVEHPIVLANRVDGRMDGTYRMELMVGPHPTVKFGDLAASSGFSNPEILNKYSIPILLGATDADVPLIIDLQTAPHVIVAGITGSGKTQVLHAFIKSTQIHSKTQGIRLVLIDPKQVDFTAYEGSPSLRYSIVRSLEGAKEVLTDINSDLDTRLATLAKSGCRDIIEYRASGKEMPFIVVVIDELAELVRDPEFAALICSIAARSRAGGVHFVVGTQHPVREVITGLLKAQFPTRVMTKTATATHSRVGIDQNGAEKLLGQGDALLLKDNGDLVRFKGAYSPPAPPRSMPKSSKPPTAAQAKGGVLSIFKAFMSVVAEPARPGKRKRQRL